MARDSRVVGRARIGAGVLAEVVNGFVDGISWKTLVCYTHSFFFQSMVNRSRLLDAFVKLNIGVYALFSGVPDDIC